MTDSSGKLTSRGHRVIATSFLVIGALLLAFAAFQLSNGNNPGKSQYSGLILAVVILALSVVEFVEARRAK